MLISVHTCDTSETCSGHAENFNVVNDYNHLNEISSHIPMTDYSGSYLTITLATNTLGSHLSAYIGTREFLGN